MNRACTFEGCTVGETGACALERDPAKCEHRTLAVGRLAGREAVTEGSPGDVVDGAGAPVLEKPNRNAPFPSSRTLGPEFVSAMMSSRYIIVVGILGDPEAGKTACLVSLYLLIANAQLKGWSFADSKSLVAFEEIARGAREWSQGQPPDQMTVRTEMADDRRPGFLHLRLVRRSDGRRFDLVLPDLPGEWTTTLVTSARADRFEFMKSAEAIWVVVDGRALTEKERRQGVISRLGQLTGRLGTLFHGSIPRMMVVITHRDLGELDGSITSRIAAELAKRDVVARIHQVAPFSEHDDVKPGFGLEDLVDATVNSQLGTVEFWPDRAPQEGSRSYLGFRRHQ